MTQEKYYTVMELAERIGVPRTTINDWLNRYAPYMDFTMQGKRRIYSENTLSVLLRISQLRASGSSSFQIESELAASYAVHPETADETPAPSPAAAPESGKEEKSGVSAAPEPATEEVSAEAAPADGEPLSPASPGTALVRNPSEDPAVLLGERFREMLEKMDRMEKRSRSSAMRAWFFFAFAAILVILLGTAGFFAHRLLRDMEKEASEKNAELARLTERATNLTAGAQSMQEQLQTLQNGLAAQEKEFHAALEENKASYEKRREAELAAQKDRFAAERLDLVRQLESSRKNAETREAEWKKQRAEADRRLKERTEALKKQEAEIDRLKKEAEKLRGAITTAPADRQAAETEQEKTVPAPASAK